MKTGNTDDWITVDLSEYAPQWSPVMKTGNTVATSRRAFGMAPPQWSPVMKTGNTCDLTACVWDGPASMEPGHEDREYLRPHGVRLGWPRLNGARS